MRLIDMLEVVTDDYTIYVYLESDLYLWRGPAHKLADYLRGMLDYFVGTLLCEMRDNKPALILDIYEPECELAEQ